MNPFLQKFIEPERISDVATAINVISDTNDIKNIEPLSGGYSSSKNYKLIIADEIFVLRIMGLDQPLDDRQKQIECLFIASKEHLAPFCYFANAETGVILMEYIEAQPLHEAFDFLGNLANMLYHLHSQQFPEPHKSLFLYTEELEATFNDVLLSDNIKNFFKQVHNAKNLLLPHLTKVACHNDLNPNNFIFDGNRLFLIDWEAAGAEDPFFDLAAVCNFFCSMSGQAAENYFLNNYFGYELSNFEQAKLCLMKLISYYFYALHFLQFAMLAKLPLNQDLPNVPTYPEWAEGFSAQQYGLTTGADFLLLGNIFVNAALTLIQTEEFKQAIQAINQK